jgi:hypothetical protein
MRGQHESEKKIQRLLQSGAIPHHRRGYHREITARHQPGCAIFQGRRCQCDAEIVVIWHERPRDTFRSEERPRSRAPTSTSLPTPPDPIWRALVQLAHPDRWQEADRGLQQASHEATVWLNAHKPSR